MKLKIREEKGITLIALVITIIVLLILAGVSIATLTGENGILTQAENAKTSNKKGKIQDEFALIANEWTIEKNAGNKTLAEFLSEKKEEGKITELVDNENGTYTMKSNGYETIINQEGKISDVFNPEEWDKTAASEECFVWGSDIEGTDGYDVIIGYTEKLQSNTKLRIPTRCKKIICDGTYYNENTYLDDQIGRAFISNVQKIEIPSTVTEIGTYAFGSVHFSQENLNEVIISNGVISIGNYAFYNCKGLKSITIPNSVTSIGNNTFYNCTGLASITIPNSVTSIGNNTFYNCIGLASITIPNSVTSIGDGTFFNCTALKSITIPDSVSNIGNSAFYNCTGLTNIIIPNSVTSIGGTAFEGCKGITSLTIPNTVKNIGWGAFYEWTSSQTINIQGYSSAPSGWDAEWNINCLATINWNQ